MARRFSNLPMYSDDSSSHLLGQGHYPVFSSSYSQTTENIGIEGLRQKLQKKKVEIKTHFCIYHETLNEMEKTLLGDLDSILEKITKEKETQERQLVEILQTETFMNDQLKTSNNEFIVKNLNNLKADIDRIKSKIRAVPRVSIRWSDNIFKQINGICQIIDPTASFQEKNPKWAMSKSNLDSHCGSINDIWDLIFDEKDFKLYILVNIRMESEMRTKIIILNSNYQYESSIDANLLWKPWIATNSKYIFIASSINCDNMIQRYTKGHATKEPLIKRFPDGQEPNTIDANEECMFSVRDQNMLIKYEVHTLEELEMIPLHGPLKEYKGAEYYNSACYTKIFGNELYILFNNSVQRTLCSFSFKGELIREIITNIRGLGNPISFCIDQHKNIYIADGKVKVFDQYGRQLYSFGKEVEKYSRWAKTVSFDSKNGHVLVWVDLNGEGLHAY